MMSLNAIENLILTQTRPMTISTFDSSQGSSDVPPRLIQAFRDIQTFRLQLTIRTGCTLENNSPITLSPISSRAWVLHKARTSSIQGLEFGHVNRSVVISTRDTLRIAQKAIGLRRDVAPRLAIGNAHSGGSSPSSLRLKASPRYP